MLFLLAVLPQKLKLKKINDTLVILIYVSLSSSSTTKTFLFLLKAKNNHSSEGDWWENTKSIFKEDATTMDKIFEKNSSFHVT